MGDRPAGGYINQLRTGAGSIWGRAVGHRMFREVAADTIADAVFTRYLRIEFGFVDTAAAVLGFAIAKAPSFAARRRLAASVHGLATDQHAFFVDAFARVGVGSNVKVLRPPRTRGLHDLFLGVARDEGYAEILAAMSAAELMYLTWCRRAYKTPSSRAVIADWVALHAGGNFATHVAWMRGQLNQIGPGLSRRRTLRMQQIFTQALECEISFHDAAYL